MGAQGINRRCRVDRESRGNIVSGCVHVSLILKTAQYKLKQRRFLVNQATY